jgi:hypothetical protein
MTSAPAAAATATGWGAEAAEVGLLSATGAGRDREELLDLGAAAGGTGDPGVTPDEELEAGIALGALIVENGHVSNVPTCQAPVK